MTALLDVSLPEGNVHVIFISVVNLTSEAFWSTCPSTTSPSETSLSGLTGSSGVLFKRVYITNPNAPITARSRITIIMAIILVLDPFFRHPVCFPFSPLSLLSLSSSILIRHIWTSIQMLLTTVLRLFFRIPGPGILYIRFAPGTSQELCCPYLACSFFHALESALVGLPVCSESPP